jgi:hypothetical protein
LFVDERARSDLVSRILCLGCRQLYKDLLLPAVRRWVVISLRPRFLTFTSRFLFVRPENFLSEAKLLRSDLWWKRARRSFVILERPRRRRFFARRTLR